MPPPRLVYWIDWGIPHLDLTTPAERVFIQRPKKDQRSRCMGRSRGGLTTKIHAVADARGRPIHLKLTEGQAHDGRSAGDMIGSIRAGTILLADRGYDSGRLRDDLKARGARGPRRLGQHPDDAGPRKHPAFKGWFYRPRNAVEWFFNNLKRFRAAATRYDKRASSNEYLWSMQLNQKNHN